jgi:ABC-type multidrug transport system fused ATPase/permease subunit
VLGVAVREEPRLFAVAVLGSALFGGMTVASAFVTGAVVGRIAVPAFDAGRTAVGALAIGAAAVLAVAVLRVVGIFGRRLGAGLMQFRLQASYRRRVTRQYLDLPLSWHQRHATGTLLSNANADVESAWYPIAPFPFAVGTLVMLVVALVALFLTDWVLALVGALVFPSVFAVNVLYTRVMSPRSRRAQALRATVSAVAHESFDGALVVKTLGREAAETERFAGVAQELRDAQVAVGRVRGLFDPVMEALPSLGSVIVLVAGTWRLSTGSTTVTEVVSVAFLFTVLSFPIRAIGRVLGELPRSVAGWERVQYVLGATGAMPYGPARLGLRGPARLELCGVSYAYPAADPAGEPRATVLDRVDLTVRPGRTVALVGATGAGKSTLVSVAVRLVDPDGGAVRVDGVDTRELAEGELAGSVALVGQTTFVFDDTVRGNVTLGAEGLAGAGGADTGIDDDAVWAALRLAQADRFVAALPDGLDTRVGERGASLSGGQRQRLALARALVRAPRLLVLDDATSSVDPAVEAAILAGLRSTDSSVLVVAYRRATIALADDVVFLDRGRVTGTGTHSELMAVLPAYADLVTAYEQADRDRCGAGRGPAAGRDQEVPA